MNLLRSIIAAPYLLLFIVAIQVSGSNAQPMPFGFQAPLPTPHRYNDVQFVSANTFVAVGASGTIIKSTDAGITWTYQWTKTHVDLNAVDFPSSNVGYVAGNSNYNSPYTLCKTIDSGQTWDTLNMGLGNDFNDVDFISPDTGWVVGVNGKIWRTNDGAQTWIDQSLVLSTAFTTIKMINSMLGFAAGENGLFYKTVDGGNTWNNLGAGTAQNSLDMFWRNANEGWLSFDGGIIKKTIDGGNTFINNSFTNGPFNVTKIHFFDSLNGIGTTTQADIVRTSNGGQTWIGGNNFQNQPLALAFDANQTGVFAGYYGCIQRSTNAGISLQNVAGANNYYHYNKIKFINSQTGFCVGEGGRVMKTTNSGQTWTLLTPNIGAALLDLHFVNTNLGFVVGVNGTVKKTINGGTTFTNVSGVPSNTDVYSVCFVDQNTGWVSGESSAVYKTNNGGTTWTQQTLPTFAFAVYQIKFINSNIGYASGAANGNLFKTTDGGNTWIQLGQNMLQLGSIREFQFFNADTGIATTSQWKFLKTTDGGATWNELAYFCVGPPALHFFNENVGVISGDNTNFNCKMYRTNDGGLTWSNTQVPFGPNINALFMTDTASIYIAGDDGSIALFGSNGGIPTLNKISGEKNLSIQVYPNPANTTITIEHPEEGQNLIVEIINLQGQVLLSATTSLNLLTLNLEHFSKGIYVVKVSGTKANLIRKLILK